MNATIYRIKRIDKVWRIQECHGGEVLQMMPELYATRTSAALAATKLQLKADYPSDAEIQTVFVESLDRRARKPWWRRSLIKGVD